MGKGGSATSLFPTKRNPVHKVQKSLKRLFDSPASSPRGDQEVDFIQGRPEDPALLVADVPTGDPTPTGHSAAVVHEDEGEATVPPRFEVTVPHGAKPGDKLQTTTPTGVKSTQAMAVPTKAESFKGDKDTAAAAAAAAAAVATTATADNTMAAAAAAIVNDIIAAAQVSAQEEVMEAAAAELCSRVIEDALKAVHGGFVLSDLDDWQKVRAVSDDADVTTPRRGLWGLVQSLSHRLSLAEADPHDDPFRWS